MNQASVHFESFGDATEPRERVSQFGQSLEVFGVPAALNIQETSQKLESGDFETGFSLLSEGESQGSECCQGDRGRVEWTI